MFTDAHGVEGIARVVRQNRRKVLADLGVFEAVALHARKLCFKSCRAGPGVHVCAHVDVDIAATLSKAVEAEVWADAGCDCDARGFERRAGAAEEGQRMQLS